MSVELPDDGGCNGSFAFLALILRMKLMRIMVDAN